MPSPRNFLILPVIFSLLIIFPILAMAEDSVAPTAARNRQQLLEERKAAAEARKAELERLKQERQASLEARRAESKTKFKERVAVMRDERKKTLIQKIEEKLANINKRRTEHFLKVLTRLEEILGKIEDRAGELKSRGVDVAAVESAVSSAGSTINTARAAVEVQAAKIYEATVNSETTAKNDVGVVMKGLEADLKAVQTIVKSARDAVHQAALALKGLKVAVTVTPVSEE